MCVCVLQQHELLHQPYISPSLACTFSFFHSITCNEIMRCFFFCYTLTSWPSLISLSLSNNKKYYYNSFFFFFNGNKKSLITLRIFFFHEIELRIPFNVLLLTPYLFASYIYVCTIQYIMARVRVQWREIWNIRV